MGTENRLDILQGMRLLPWDWHNIGAAFGSRAQHSKCLSGRADVVVRRGYDEGEDVDYGRVVEGLGALGLNLRSREYSFTLSASSLSYKSGNDAPLKAQSFVGAPLPSLRFTVATEYKEDRFAAVSYDLARRRPEVSLGWSGDTLQERSTVTLHLDPLEGAADLRAAVSFPGPEWRVKWYDPDTQVVHYPQDDGGRHRLWVQQRLHRAQLLGPTQAGARIDLGRAANALAAFVDEHVAWRLPGVVWHVPLSHRLYRLLVPRPDAQQVRHHVRGWSLSVDHDFERGGAPTLGLTKQLGGSALSATYDPDTSTAGLTLAARGLSAGLQLSRTADGRWSRNPQVSLRIEPLAFL